VNVTAREIRRSAAHAAVAAMLLAASGCGAQPVGPSACSPTPVARQGSLLVVQADPPESSIRAVLPAGAPATAGRATAVRWLVDARKASAQLRFQASREGTSAVYRQSFASSGTSGQLAEFQGGLVFPAPGCWDADVSTGTAAGSLTFRVG
jgi:hypothetical protein